MLSADSTPASGDTLLRVPVLLLLVGSAAWPLGCATSRTQPASARPSAPSALAPAQLWCTYTYGGEAKRLLVAPTRDPYRATAVKIERRFELKVVYVDAPADVAGVRIYSYYPGPDAPVLIHEAKYELLRPGHGPYGFTGQQLVYEPRGGELAYYCEWSER
ncbi:MAG TPA: hypothetical protein VG937_13945 [Polyangiaceae bacterium]|nr:hypothetical protein [Polyangiaceae bacterium]